MQTRQTRRRHGQRCVEYHRREAPTAAAEPVTLPGRCTVCSIHWSSCSTIPAPARRRRATSSRNRPAIASWPLEGEEVEDKAKFRISLLAILVGLDRSGRERAPKGSAHGQPIARLDRVNIHQVWIFSFVLALPSGMRVKVMVDLPLKNFDTVAADLSYNSLLLAREKGRHERDRGFRFLVMIANHCHRVETQSVTKDKAPSLLKPRQERREICRNE